jgi:hypothetical protein
MANRPGEKKNQDAVLEDIAARLGRHPSQLEHIESDAVATLKTANTVFYFNKYDMFRGKTSYGRKVPRRRGFDDQFVHCFGPVLLLHDFAVKITELYKERAKQHYTTKSTAMKVTISARDYAIAINQMAELALRRPLHGEDDFETLMQLAAQAVAYTIEVMVEKRQLARLAQVWYNLDQNAFLNVLLAINYGYHFAVNPHVYISESPHKFDHADQTLINWSRSSCIASTCDYA